GELRNVLDLPNGRRGEVGLLDDLPSRERIHHVCQWLIHTLRRHFQWLEGAGSVFQRLIPLSEICLECGGNGHLDLYRPIENRLRLSQHLLPFLCGDGLKHLAVPW